MQKKIKLLFLSLITAMFMILPVCAEGSNTYRVVDQANLLTDQEEQSLNTKLREISERQQVDVAIMTVNSIPEGYSVRGYADTVYEDSGYGYGANKDGLMLLISMEDHDWYITTMGYGITAFTDAGIQYIGDQITTDLAAKSYAKAFETYANLCDEFITQAKSGNPYDVSDLRAKQPLAKKWIFISIGIGLVIGICVVSSMSAKMRTVHSQSAAKDYIKKDSLNITRHSDLYLYHTITKRKIEKSSSSGHGGSSTHHSSSGGRHGGGGGKF